MATQTISPPVRALPDLLHELQRFPSGTNILSVYLDTSPARLPTRDYLVALRDGCKAVRAGLPGTEEAGSFLLFDRAVAAVERVLAMPGLIESPAMALFAPAGGDEALAAVVPIPTVDRVTWGEHPVLEPLEEALDEHERIAVVLFDKERARLISIYLGKIEETLEIADVVPGKQATGDWFGLAQKRYARHHEQMVLHHAKRTIRLATTQLRRLAYDRLFVGGPDEAISVLLDQLPTPLRTRLAGTLSLELFASDDEVLHAALAAAERAERADELTAINDLVETRMERHVRLGPESTFGALHEARVQRLFVVRDHALAGARCQTCGRLTTMVGLCPACAGETAPVDDLLELALTQAREQGARVEFVEGEAATILRSHGSLAARVRY